MADVTAAIPGVLRDYTAQTRPRVAEARGVLSEYQLAVQAFNAAPKDEVQHEIPDRTSMISDTMDWLELIDEYPAIFAEALEAVDRQSFFPGRFGDLLHRLAVSGAFLERLREEAPEAFAEHGFASVWIEHGEATAQALEDWAAQTPSGQVSDLAELLEVVDRYGQMPEFQQALLGNLSSEAVAAIAHAERAHSGRLGDRSGNFGMVVGAALEAGRLSVSHQRALLGHRNTDMVVDYVTGHEGWDSRPLGELGVAVLTDPRWLPRGPRGGDSYMLGGGRQSAVLDAIAKSPDAAAIVLAHDEARPVLLTTDYDDDGLAAGNLVQAGLLNPRADFALADAVFRTVATEGVGSDGTRVALARATAPFAEEMARQSVNAGANTLRQRCGVGRQVAAENGSSQKAGDLKGKMVRRCQRSGPEDVLGPSAVIATVDQRGDHDGGVDDRH